MRFRSRPPDELRAENERLRARAERERRARHEAETIAEEATRDLYFTVERLEQLNEELTRALAVRDRLVGVTVDRLVLPMASVNQLSSALDRRWDEIPEANRRMYVSMIDQQAASAGHYVQDLVVVAHVGASALDVDATVVTLAPVLTDIVAVELEGDGELSCDPDLRARVDEQHLRRILRSLFRNAVEHGRPPFETHVERDRDEIAIHVVDHGDGIRQDFRERLFDPFTTAETVVPSEQTRAGIGLAIANHLSRLQGGSLRFEPNRPTGCRFTLRLPAA